MGLAYVANGSPDASRSGVDRVRLAPVCKLGFGLGCDPDASRRYDLSLLLLGHVCGTTTFGPPLAVGDPRTSPAASGIRGGLPRPPSNRQRVPGPAPPSRCRSGAGYLTTLMVATGDQLAALLRPRNRLSIPRLPEDLSDRRHPVFAGRRIPPRRPRARPRLIGAAVPRRPRASSGPRFLADPARPPARPFP